jgi:hypothetical protein
MAFSTDDRSGDGTDHVPSVPRTRRALDGLMLLAFPVLAVTAIWGWLGPVAALVSVPVLAGVAWLLRRLDRASGSSRAFNAELLLVAALIIFLALAVFANSGKPVLGAIALLVLLDACYERRRKARTAFRRLRRSE